MSLTLSFISSFSFFIFFLSIFYIMFFISAITFFFIFKSFFCFLNIIFYSLLFLFHESLNSLEDINNRFLGKFSSPFLVSVSSKLFYFCFVSFPYFKREFFLKFLAILDCLYLEGDTTKLIRSSIQFAWVFSILM